MLSQHLLFMHRLTVSYRIFPHKLITHNFQYSICSKRFQTMHMSQYFHIEYRCSTAPHLKMAMVRSQNNRMILALAPSSFVIENLGWHSKDQQKKTSTQSPTTQKSPANACMSAFQPDQQTNNTAIDRKPHILLIIADDGIGSLWENMMTMKRKCCWN